MKKISIFLSLLLMVSMLLTACGAEETSTSVPSTNVPPITAEVTNTGEAPSGTETTATADTTTTPEVPVTGGEDPSRVSNQLDFDVWNQDGEQVGEVEDMILDLDNSRIAYVIVGTGGFLELGEKEVLVPWNSLQLQTEPGDTTGGQNAFVLQTDQDSFNNAPDVDLDAVLPEMGTPAGDWDTDIRNYWESGTLPATAAPDATAAPETTATAPAEGTVTGTADVQGVVLASDVLGSNITLSPGQGEGAGQGTGQSQGQATATAGTDATQATATVDPGQGSGQGVGNFNGTIDDLIVDIDTGDIRYIVVDAAFDDGERWIPIPLSFFQWDTNNGAFALNVNPAMLQDAPFFQDGQYPDMTVEGWDSDFNSFWQNQ
jgi:sporulation protein YlmC with PRC-barrel domain